MVLKFRLWLWTLPVRLKLQGLDLDEVFLVRTYIDWTCIVMTNIARTLLLGLILLGLGSIVLSLKQLLWVRLSLIGLFYLELFLFGLKSWHLFFCFRHQLLQPHFSHRIRFEPLFADFFPIPKDRFH